MHVFALTLTLTLTLTPTQTETERERYIGIFTVHGFGLQEKFGFFPSFGTKVTTIYSVRCTLHYTSYIVHCAYSMHFQFQCKFMCIYNEFSEEARLVLFFFFFIFLGLDFPLEFQVSTIAYTI